MSLKLLTRADLMKWWWWKLDSKAMKVTGIENVDCKRAFKLFKPFKYYNCDENTKLARKGSKNMGCT